MKKVIQINLLILLVSIIAIEIGLRFFPIPDPYEKEKVSILYYFKPATAPHRELHFFIEDSLPGFDQYKKEVTYLTNNMGFRGTKETNVEKAEGVFRIFAVGGSTTQSYVMDEGDDWPALLGGQLNTEHDGKFEVINTGQSGHSLSDHLHLIIQKLIYLNPDLFIVYAGANDVDKLLTTQDLYQTNVKNARQDQPAKFLATEFQLGRRLHYLLKGYSHNEIHLTSEASEKARNTLRALPPETNLPELDFEYSLDNLRAIIGVCQSLNIKLMVITQAVSWDETDSEMDNWHFMVNKQGKRFDERVLNRLNADLNKGMIEVCGEMEVPFFNAQDYLSPTSENFYDDMHLNYEGNMRMAQLVYDFLQKNSALIKP
ncbi:MAG: SGNH/GDSL hydrolase family protein [Roseivirga sp.]|nr:SGNH/GDSL hydrolase family protein [Roseivirga sp.]